MAEISAADAFQKMAAAYEKAVGGATRIVAKHLVELALPMKNDSRILDNACGTGIVTEEILNQAGDNASQQIQEIHAVDAAQAMVGLVQKKAESIESLPQGCIHVDALPAEGLDALPSDHFDYSFTNFGFQFFKDPNKAAAHVHRTLKGGGKAFITAWKNMGYLDAVWKASSQIRPGSPPPKLPFDEAWFTASHLEKVCRQGGFSDVKIHEQESKYTATSMADLANNVYNVLSPFAKAQGWSEEELGRFPEALKSAFESYSEGIIVEPERVSLDMVANVAVCVK